MNWNIITDSSCDLLPFTSPDGRIRLTSVPFTIRIGERDFVDDEHLDTMEMLSAMEQEHSAGHTSCPTPDAWLAQFEQADCAIAAVRQHEQRSCGKRYGAGERSG